MVLNFLFLLGGVLAIRVERVLLPTNSLILYITEKSVLSEMPNCALIASIGLFEDLLNESGNILEKVSTFVSILDT